MNVKVSVIVPVYQVKQYLDECIQSILEQTERNLEIILVDDGSTDGCAELCDRYARQYEMIQVVHQENSGQPAARNTGLNIANGQYIAFCDSDDRMKPPMLETMVQVMETNDADIGICGYETFPNGRVTNPGFPEKVVMSPADMLDQCSTIHSGNELCFSWRFMFKRSFLQDKGLRFNEELRIGEDMIFNARAVISAKKVVAIHEALYEYRIDNPNSIMRTKYKKNLEYDLSIQYQEKLKINSEFGLEQNETWMEDFGYYYVTGFLSMLIRNALAGPVSDRRKAIRRALNLPMIRQGYRLCDQRLRRVSRRARIYHAACKYRLYPVVEWIVQHGAC